MAAVGFFASAPAVAAGSTISVAPATVRAGRTVVFSGSIPTTGTGSCPAGDPATLTSPLFPPDGWGPAAPRSADGAFRVVYAVPTTTPAGTYQIGLRCGGGNVGIQTTLRVTASAPPTASPTPSGSRVKIWVVPAGVRAGHTVAVGGTLPMSGVRSCPPSDTLILTSSSALFPPDGFGPQVSRDPSGAFRVNYTVPRATPADAYQIGLRCSGGNVGIATTLRVTTRAGQASAHQTPSSTPQAGQGGGGGTSSDNTSAGWPAAGWLAVGLAGGALAAALGMAAWRRWHA